MAAGVVRQVKAVGGREKAVVGNEKAAVGREKAVGNMATAATCGKAVMESVAG